MSHRRQEKEQKKEQSIEQRVSNIEQFINNGDDTAQNINMLVTTIRLQGQNIEQLNNDVRQMMINEGTKNSFLVEKKLTEEYKSYVVKLMDEMKKQQTAEAIKEQWKSEPPKQIENNEGPEQITPTDKGIIERKAVNDK